MKELDADEFKRLGHIAVELAAEHIYSMRDRPVFTPMTAGERSAILNSALPESGLLPSRVLDFVRDHVLTHPMGNGHPRFFGWANSSPSSMGVLSEFLAAAMNPSCAGGDHAAIYLERCVVRWLMELTRFPVQGSQGLLVSGGSMAALICLAAARQRALSRAGCDVRELGMSGTPPLVMYMSDQGHSSLLKAAGLLGIGHANVRVIPTGKDFRMDVDRLDAVITQDRKAGLTALCVCASAGTMNTGTLDPLRAIAEVCMRQQVWFHIDGALGGMAALDSSLPELSAMALSDSLSLDPHKWLGVPIECGVAMVRDQKRLRETFSLVPFDARLEAAEAQNWPAWFSEYGLEQTRGFRALKLWATLAHLGTEGLRLRIAQHRALARSLAASIAAEPALELLNQPELAIVCFRYVRIPEPSELRLRVFNQALAAQLQAEGEVFLTGVDLRPGCYALRVSIMHHATRSTDVTAMMSTLLKTAARLNEAAFSAM